MVIGLVSSLLGRVVALSNVEGRGWGDHLEWHTLEDGMREASRQKKPLMVIVHMNSCPACRFLKSRFSKFDPVSKLSRDFVMVNLDKDEVPRTSTFAPDGNYVPRILFFTPSGKLMQNVKNKYLERFQFTYSDPAFLVDSMKDAVKIASDRRLLKQVYDE